MRLLSYLITAGRVLTHAQLRRRDKAEGALHSDIGWWTAFAFAALSLWCAAAAASERSACVAGQMPGSTERDVLTRPRPSLCRGAFQELTFHVIGPTPNNIAKVRSACAFFSRDSQRPAAIPTRQWLTLPFSTPSSRPQLYRAGLQWALLLSGLLSFYFLFQALLVLRVYRAAMTRTERLFVSAPLSVIAGAPRLCPPCRPPVAPRGVHALHLYCCSPFCFLSLAQAGKLFFCSRMAPAPSHPRWLQQTSAQTALEGSLRWHTYSSPELQ